MMDKYYEPRKYDSKLGYGASSRAERNYENYAGEYTATEEILKQRAAKAGAIMPEPKLQITIEHMLDLLNGSLDRLHEKISAVENAISPVLKPSDPQAVKASTADGNHAPVNWSLITINERIGYEIERLDDMYRRAEVI